MSPSPESQALSSQFRDWVERLTIPEHDLEDLRGRLDRVRLPEAETVQDGMQGIGSGRLPSLLDAWREHDWRSVERRWNAIPHYRARLDRPDIAFWHVRSPEPGAFRFVLRHGWPGSVLEFENARAGTIGSMNSAVGG